MKHISEYDIKLKELIKKDQDLEIPLNISHEFRGYLKYLRGIYYKLKEKIDREFDFDNPSKNIKLELKCIRLKNFITGYNDILKNIGIYTNYRYISPLKEIYDLNDNLIELKFGESIFIYGRIGSGKTTFITSQAIKYYINGFSILFINEEEWFNRIKNYSKYNRQIEIDKIKNAHILFYDDLESYKASFKPEHIEFRNIQYVIFDYRISNNLTTITTANNSIKELLKNAEFEENQDQYHRIISRLNHLHSRKIQFKNIDYRISQNLFNMGE